MAIKFPTTQEEISKLQTNFKNNLPVSNPYLQSIFQAIIIAIGMSISLVYDFFKYKVFPQILPFNPTDEYAEYWGNLIGVPRYDGHVSSGYVNFTGVVGTSIPIGTKLLDSNSNLYKTLETKSITYTSQNISTLTQSGGVATVTTTTAHNLSSGMSVNITNTNQSEYWGSKIITVISSTIFTYNVDVLAVSPATPISGSIYYYANFVRVNISSDTIGLDKNLLPSNRLVIESNSYITNIDTIVYVDANGLSGGLDLETNINYNTRYRDIWSNPITPFNENYINSIMIYDFGAYRSWTLPCTDLSGADIAGVFSTYFVFDGVSKFLPTPTDIQNATDLLIALKPAIIADDSILIGTPVQVDVDFVFTSLSPNTNTMQTAIEENLINYFNNYPQLGEDVKEIDYLSIINNTVDENGETVSNFTITSPSGDITIDYNEIAQLGTITI